MISSDMTNKDIKINVDNRRCNNNQDLKHKNIFKRIMSFFNTSNKNCKCKCGGR
jgi:hypothetical protein